jgi:cytochrome c biogenesis protein CcmG/thiol:disulfide interchange protein DsbE
MKATSRLKRLCLYVLTAMLLNGCSHRPGLQIGDPMPAVELSDVKGHAVALPGGLKGKVMLVRFWALDCDFCSKEILFGLEKLYQKYKDLGFVPVVINECRAKVDDARLKRFAALSYPLLSDQYGLVAKQFGVIALPTTFIFDEEGVLRDKITGEANLDELEKRFTTVLYKGEFYDSTY